MQKPQLPYRSLIVLSCPLRIPRSLRFLPSHGRFSYPTNLTPLIRQNISAQKTRNSILNTTLVRFAYLISLCSLTPQLSLNPVLLLQRVAKIWLRLTTALSIAGDKFLNAPSMSFELFLERFFIAARNEDHSETVSSSPVL